jgi:hypothetical protein
MEQIELMNMVKGVIKHKKNALPLTERFLGEGQKRQAGNIRETAVTLH